MNEKDSVLTFNSKGRFQGLSIVLPGEQEKQSEKSLKLDFDSQVLDSEMVNQSNRKSYVGEFDIEKYHKQKAKDKIYLDHF